MTVIRLLAEDTWLIRLIANHIGYFSFAIPIAILFLISKRSFYTKWPAPIRRCITSLIRIFISDIQGTSLSDVNGKGVSSSLPPTKSMPSNFTRYDCFQLTFAFFGLQFSYLLWGLLQERIMTRSYDGEKFSNSQYLVFVNRVLAMIVAFTALKVFYPTKNILSTGPPLVHYGIISYANCMSTWFQYESLLYISFPVQVIAKSIKTIPVMIAGKLVSGKSYPPRQYLIMLVMTIGFALFLSGYQQNDGMTLSAKVAKQKSTTINGLILLACYLTFDAFTSNYQKHIFDRYSISFLQMMLFVNCISSALTFTSLLFNGTLLESLLFMKRHQLFLLHTFATSICSSVGQLFIFSTIEKFGPVTFTIIMTLRQAFSILLSCIFYGHELSWFSVLGVNVTFMAVLLHAFLQLKKSKLPNTNIV